MRMVLAITLFFPVAVLAQTPGAKGDQQRHYSFGAAGTEMPNSKLTSRQERCFFASTIALPLVRTRCPLRVFCVLRGNFSTALRMSGCMYAHTILTGRPNRVKSIGP